MPLVPGSRLGAYEILGLLGEGGMGQVYRARDTQLDRDVAIKILPDLFAADPDRVVRFEREAKALAGITAVGVLAFRAAAPVPVELPPLTFRLTLPGLAFARNTLPSLSPDGRRIAYVADGGRYPRWSPTGDRIYYRSGTAGADGVTGVCRSLSIAAAR